jgi:RimJ/RimL family protein N-acetyltransferase
LRLHALTEEEAEVLHAGVLPVGWSYDAGYPLPDTKDGVGLYLRHGDRDYGFHFVVRREDERVIGEIGFVAPPRGGAVTVGYAIVPAARRQGYATEAIAGLAEWSLAQPGVGVVRAQTLPDNEASIRALLRAGFEEEEPGSKVRRFVRTPG